MTQFPATSHGRAPASHGGRRGAVHRLLLAPAIALAAVALLLVPALASADSASSLTVVGTSDVSDSGLIQNVVQPAFHAAYPQYTFKYVGTATGTAINDAETGSQGASVLIVHAASLENQFVANGYSNDNAYGYAIWRNDFVLAGPAGDPAGVAANASSNIAQAFADIASAGINGDHVTFVSRGGTPGTTVSEHSIWALVDSSGLAPNGLLLCAVSAANGGGETPIAAGNGVTASGQSCPNDGALPSGAALPPWYAATGLTQGPNVLNASACSGYPSGPSSCYVYTDRGTYDYLASGLDPAGSIVVSGTNTLPIATRGPQPASAPGGADQLINYFHAYVINPSKPNEAVNLTAAQDFVDLITSPALQAQLAKYLDDTSDSAGAPFIADASPDITEAGLPTTATAGSKVTVTGTVTNAELGYPALGGVAVSVDELIAGQPVPVASGTTNSDGTYTLSFKPKSAGAYEVTTPQIKMVENAYLNPQFGDILSPAATSPVYLKTLSGLPAPHAIKFKHTKVKKHRLTVTGTLKPGPALGGARVELFGLNLSGRGAEHKLAVTRVGKGKTSFRLRHRLGKGTWVLQLEYVQKGQTSSYSGLKKVHVK
jgi:ABC-type tungstate transport system permease subunit